MKEAYNDLLTGEMTTEPSEEKKTAKSKHTIRRKTKEELKQLLLEVKAIRDSYPHGIQRDKINEQIKQLEERIKDG